MNAKKENIESLEKKLKLITQGKITKEKYISKLRNNERGLIDEIAFLKTQNEFMEEKVKEYKIKIAQINTQISMIEICKTTEKVKTETQISQLAAYSKNFQQFFEKERDIAASRSKESREKEIEEEEKLKVILAERNKQQAREINAIELEREAIQKECAVLRKRNNAILLKLRRKLLETENIRREFIKRCEKQHLTGNRLN